MYSSSLKGKSNYTFKVPVFIVGLPLYNYDTCLVYLIKALREKDYYVRFHTPSWLYISWDENPEENTLLLLQDETNRTNTLLNENNRHIPQLMNPIIKEISTVKSKLPSYHMLTDNNNRPINDINSCSSGACRLNSHRNNNRPSLKLPSSKLLSVEESIRMPINSKQTSNTFIKTNPSEIQSNDKNISILTKINTLR